jgi:hypothetical protein
MAVADAGIEGRMESWNEPVPGPHAGNDVELGEPIVLGLRKAGAWSPRIVIMSWRAAPRLDEFDVDEEPLQGAGKIRRLLEFCLAPWNFKVVVQQHVAGAADDDMGFAPAIRAREVSQIVDL